jgi:hypothetical protein
VLSFVVAVFEELIINPGERERIDLKAVSLGRFPTTVLKFRIEVPRLEF